MDNLIPDHLILQAYLRGIISSLLKLQTPSSLPWFCVLPVSPNRASLTWRWKQHLSRPPSVVIAVGVQRSQSAAAPTPANWLTGKSAHGVIMSQVQGELGETKQRG